MITEDDVKDIEIGDFILHISKTDPSRCGISRVSSSVIKDTRNNHRYIYNGIIIMSQLDTLVGYEHNFELDFNETNIYNIDLIKNK